MADKDAKAPVLFYARGHLGSYLVSQRRSRRGVLQGSSTAVVLKLPEDHGEALGPIHGQRVEVTIKVLPPDQQNLLD